MVFSGSETIPSSEQNGSVSSQASDRGKTSELPSVCFKVGKSVLPPQYLQNVPPRLLRAKGRQRLLVRNLEKVEREKFAYAAGLIDGDGHIGVNRVTDRPHSFSVKLRVQMNDFGPPYFLWKIFGGTFNGPMRPGRNAILPVYAWALSGGLLASFLLKVEPFLRGKREQAHIARLFCRRLRPGRTVTREELSYRELLFYKLRSLHGHKKRTNAQATQ